MFRNCIQRQIIKPFAIVKPVFGYYWDFVQVLIVFDQFNASFLKKSEIRLKSENWHPCYMICDFSSMSLFPYQCCLLQAKCVGFFSPNTTGKSGSLKLYQTTFCLWAAITGGTRGRLLSDKRWWGTERVDRLFFTVWRHGPWLRCHFRGK